jgi:small subunit ribosomal protein S6e
LIKKHVIRRTFKSKKNANAALRNKAPKIQRLVTEARLRRKRIQKEDKVKRWRRTIALTTEYKKVHDTWAAKRRTELKQIRKASKTSEKAPEASKPQEPKKAQVAAAPVKQAVAKPKKA